MTGCEIGQLPLELASDAIEVAAALRQETIDPGLGFCREVVLPHEESNGIPRRFDAAHVWFVVLKDDRRHVSLLRLAQESRQFSANDRGHPRRNEDDLA